MKMRYLPGVATLRLFEENCNGCRLCLAVCPRGVFEMRERKAVVIDRDACLECGACARNCEFGALTVKAGAGCAAAFINSALGRTEACCVADEGKLVGGPGTGETAAPAEGYEQSGERR